MGTNAGFDTPTDVKLDSLGHFYICDSRNHAIRKATPAGTKNIRLSSNYPLAFEVNSRLTIGLVSLFAGGLGSSNHGNTDGVGALARFCFPKAIAVDLQGYVYVADTANHLIRKISPIGTHLRLQFVCLFVCNVVFMCMFMYEFVWCFSLQWLSSLNH